MPTIPTHALVAATIFTTLTGSPRVRRRAWPAGVWLAGAICAMVPDLDVIGFSLGVRYGDLLGHRGLTHSLAFAAALAAFVAIRFPSERVRIWTFLFACTASHGLLDAATDGGLGVAFFSPFSNHRYFWPWRPLIVSPIGLGFFSDWGLAVIGSELVWIWLPCAALVGLAAIVRALLPRPARLLRGRLP